MYSAVAIGIISLACSKDDTTNTGASNTGTVNDTTTATVTFSANINPLITAQCGISNSACHNGTVSARGDYRTYAGIKVKVDDGTFKTRTTVTQDMPLGSTLSQADQALITAWLDAGAKND